MHFAVWFPSISKNSLHGIIWPQDADPNFVLTLEDINNPQKSIDRIFKYDILNSNIQTSLSDADHEFLLDNSLCPSFDILPPKSYEINNTKQRFNAMLVEQYGLLNYLEYQRCAISWV